MKLSTVLVTVLMGLLIGNTTIANEGITKEKVEVKIEDNFKFVLQASKLETKSSIEIQNEEGEVLFSETTGKKTSYAKVFDLSQLSDGKYNFVVISGGEVITKSFKIATKRTVSQVQ